MELNKMKYKELNDYLYGHSVFGFTARKRKHIIIYLYKRYLVSQPGLILKIKVDRHTKNVISILYKDKEYTDFDDIKKLVE